MSIRGFFREMVMLRFKGFLLIFGVLLSGKGSAMSPFTGDSKIISEVLLKSDIWKSMSGPIKSFQISKRSHETTKNGEYINRLVLTVSAGNPPDFPDCVGEFQVASYWEFMSLVKVDVVKISSKCVEVKK